MLKTEVLDMLEPAQLVEFFYENKKRIFIGSASVLCGAILLIGYFQSEPSALNYAEAESAVARWEASPLDAQLYKGMRAAIQTVPAIAKKYEASIAQNLLNVDRIDEALIMANRALKRVKEEVPYHATFAESSLLIKQGKFQQALENAVTLKERMGSSFLKEDKGGSILYIHNLLRIACLQQMLKNRPGEKAAWEELEAVLQSNTKGTKALLGSFSAPEVDLNQYIQERKKEL